MISCYPRRPMRWNVAIGAIARCKATSIGCARKRRSVCALHWTCGVKPKPKGVNKPLHHFIVHGLDKPGCSATVSKSMRFLPRNFLCHKPGKLLEGHRPGGIIGPDHGDVLFFHRITEERQGIPPGGLLGV